MAQEHLKNTDIPSVFTLPFTIIAYTVDDYKVVITYNVDNETYPSIYEHRAERESRSAYNLCIYILYLKRMGRYSN